MNYPFLDGAPPGFVARIDQLHAEYSHRIMAAIMLAMGSKVLYRHDRPDDSRYLAETIGETVRATDDNEIRDMLVICLDMLANAALGDLSDEDEQAMIPEALKAVAFFKEDDGDSSDRDGTEEGLGDVHDLWPSD